LPPIEILVVEPLVTMTNFIVTLLTHILKLGTVSFGHYWIYIYDFQRNIWRKYNDGYVTEVTDETEIFEQEANNPATPYFLIYVQDKYKDELVDAVCRDITDE
jgi:ubiquitin carboxyl-terminal hydrolase 25